ncbi:MAG: hypothetical protein RLZZ303_2024 [Candidatus Hydrogenedentota bacterium]|jgi:uncharacterized protein with ATP-grasp and redox domains
MKAQPDCLACFMNQALRAARLATPEETVHREVLADTAAAIPAMDLNVSPATLSIALYESAIARSGNADPFYQQKREQNALALGLEDELRDLIAQSADPLDTALHVAAAGNTIDLGALQSHEIDIHAALEQVLRERFAIDHSARLKQSLRHCGDLLYLLDNAGEIVFDKLLIEQLLQHTPVTAVVKGAPIINDALLEDAEEVGLPALCEVIDNGGGFVGSPLDLVPESFLARMRAADVIIGKGQGNYETVDTFDGDVFLILKAKCQVVARHMGVNYGQVALISTRERATLAGSAVA